MSLLNILCKIGGADSLLIAGHCKSDHNKYGSLGLMITICPAMSFAATYYLMIVVFNVQGDFFDKGTVWLHCLTIIIPAVWALMLFNFYRFASTTTSAALIIQHNRLHRFIALIPFYLAFAAFSVSTIPSIITMIIANQDTGELSAAQSSTLSAARSDIELVYGPKFESEFFSLAEHLEQQKVLKELSAHPMQLQHSDSGDTPSSLSAQHLDPSHKDENGSAIAQMQADIQELINADLNKIATLRKEKDAKLNEIKDSIIMNISFLGRVFDFIKYHQIFSFFLLISLMILFTLPIILNFIFSAGIYEYRVFMQNAFVLAKYGISPYGYELSNGGMRVKIARFHIPEGIVRFVRSRLGRAVQR